MTDEREEKPVPREIQEVIRDIQRDGDPLKEGGGVRPQQPNPFSHTPPSTPPSAPPPPPKDQGDQQTGS
jgi:hypothetical protein